MHDFAVTFDPATSLATLLLMISGALVLLMILGSAFFYGGLVRATSVVSMLIMSFGAIALVSILWILFGYGMVYGTPLIPHWLGNPFSELGLQPIVDGLSTSSSSMYQLAFAGFQAMFAIIAVALISGAIADRAKFSAWMVFVGVWVTLVYFPVAYWVFNDSDGWAASVLKVNDFAGGAAVHINAGAAALALALVLGKRVGFAKGFAKPHNVPLTMFGAALLWFGWFGFNVGSEASVDGIAALVWVNTLAAPAAAILTWLIVQTIREDKPTATGAASGAIAGLVAITPAANILTPGWALLLGGIAGAVCAMAVELKFRFGFDDSLDVVGIHLVGGLIGMLYIGLFGSGVGMVDAGSFYQLGVQAIAAVAVMVYSFGMTWLIGTAIHKTLGFRVDDDTKLAGVDLLAHGESGYSISSD
jgi:ammonium transporter, Amt family